MRLKLGFVANPTGGPGIFLTRLKAELEAMGCFDAEKPHAWVQLCYEPLTESIAANTSIAKLIRVDGVYHQYYKAFPWFKTPFLDTLVSQRKNARRNRPIAKNLAVANTQNNGIVYQSAFCRWATNRFIAHTQEGATIFNGVDTRQFAPCPKPAHNQNTVDILVSHSFRPHKRLHEAIRILSALQSRLPEKPITLHVVGGDDGNSIAYAQQVMAQLNITEESVRFYGKQPYQQLQSIYTQCDFVLGLSFWDFCPNVIVEALSCGLPVLGVDFGGIPELVGSAGRLIPETIPTGYLDLYDFKALPKVDADRYAEEALQLLENLSDYQAMARERALSALDIRHTAKQYLTYAEALLPVGNFQ